MFPIIGKIPDSFQEYSPYWAFVLFCAGCNLSCKECYNLSAIKQNKIIGDGISVLQNELNESHEAVVFLGGEPTIHSSLIDVLKFCKKRNLKTKIYTNGQKPDFFTEEVLTLIDACSIDVKAVKNISKIVDTDISDFEYLFKIEQLIQKLSFYRKEYEIRTTKWKCVEDQLDQIKEYVEYRFPSTHHIIQENFTV